MFVTWNIHYYWLIPTCVWFYLLFCFCDVCNSSWITSPKIWHLTLQHALTNNWPRRNSVRIFVDNRFLWITIKIDRLIPTNMWECTGRVKLCQNLFLILSLYFSFQIAVKLYKGEIGHLQCTSDECIFSFYKQYHSFFICFLLYL